jgi:hypothetical protein
MKIRETAIALQSLLVLGGGNVWASSPGEEAKGQLVAEWHCSERNGSDVLVKALVYEAGDYNAEVVAAGVTNPAAYSVRGFEMRWNFGELEENIFPYALVIEPNGSSRYYDFSKSPKGTIVQPSQFYQCRKVK